MDIGSFNVFALLNRSNVKLNYKELTAAASSFTVPAGVSEISVLMAGSGGAGGSAAVGGGGGGAGATLWIPRLPVFTGLILACQYQNLDGITYSAGPAPGGVGASGASGTNGRATILKVAAVYAAYHTGIESAIIARGGLGGLNTGVGSAGGGITNVIASGGGKSGGASTVGGTGINIQTEFLDLLLGASIRVPGCGGSGRSVGSAIYGGSSFALGGETAGPFPAGGGGGASLLGKGGGGFSSIPGVAGVRGSGGGGSVPALAGGNGGDGFCIIFWKGKKE